MEGARLALSDAQGPLKDLLGKLSGEDGLMWLAALTRMLNKEDPWGGGAVVIPREDFEDRERRECREYFERREREIIKRALKECGGKLSRATRVLGISRPTLERKIKEHQIELTDL